MLAPFVRELDRLVIRAGERGRGAMAGSGHWQGETSVDQDGLVPVVKFLQSALAMKAKVRRFLARDRSSFLLGIMTNRVVCLFP